MEFTQKQFDHANGNYLLDSHGPKKALKILWKKNNFEATSAPFVYEGILYIAVDGFFYALNPDTGNTIWKFEIPAKGTMPVFHENILIFGGNHIDNHVYALDKNTGIAIWKYSTGSYTASVSRNPVIYKNLIYFLAGKRIHCLSLTGKKQWTFDLKKKVGRVNLTIASGRMYSVTDEGMDKQELHCIDNNKQELVWKIKTPNLWSNLLHVQDYLFYLNSNAELCEVNLINGDVIKSKILSFEPINRVHNGSLTYHNGMLIIVVAGYILGLNLTTNPWSWQWNFSVGSDIGRPIITDSIIYFSTIWNGIYALDLQTGEQLLNKESEVRSAFACGVFDSKIFVAGSMNEHELTAYRE